MSTELISNIVGVVLGFPLIITAKYWLPIDKLSNILTLTIATIFIYGCASLVTSLTAWWLE